MVNRIPASSFFEQHKNLPVVDVRSPAEYEEGHIYGAINIPIFSNEERAIVGTLYKKAGKEAAIFKGLDFVGVKMSGFVKKLTSALHGKPRKTVIYCWRGGMRSSSMAWLFSTTGFETFVIEGGYKACRAYIREQSGTGSPMIVLGGMTGSGKTEILHELKRKGQQVIDLEGLAHNKGSVFGYLGQTPQPSNEQFENDLYAEWLKLDPNKPVWIEDESRSIGVVGLPNPFFDRMKTSLLLLLDVPAEIRVERLVREYAGFDNQLLIDALNKISQPMGGVCVKEAETKIMEDDYAPAIRLVLDYYDKTYRKALTKYTDREVTEVKSETGNALLNAELVMRKLGQVDLGIGRQGELSDISDRAMGRS